jgi:hypothetical protein
VSALLRFFFDVFMNGSGVTEACLAIKSASALWNRAGLF